MSQIRIEILKHISSGGESRFGDAYLPSEIAKKVHGARREVWEELWTMVADGLIFIDPRNQPGVTNWNIALTEKGEKAVLGEEWLPEDVDSYLTRLCGKIPDLDRAIEMYMKEAILAFNADCYLASSVMLGVAAERSFIIAAEAMLDSGMAGLESFKKKFENDNASYFSKWVEFRKKLEPMKSDLPQGLNDPLFMNAIGELIRLTRNSAAHPSGDRLEREAVKVLLEIAPMYLVKMNELKKHFEGNPV